MKPSGIRNANILGLCLFNSALAWRPHGTDQSSLALEFPEPNSSAVSLVENFENIHRRKQVRSYVTDSPSPIGTFVQSTFDRSRRNGDQLVQMCQDLGLPDAALAECTRQISCLNVEGDGNLAVSANMDVQIGQQMYQVIYYDKEGPNDIIPLAKCSCEEGLYSTRKERYYERINSLRWLLSVVRQGLAYVGYIGHDRWWTSKKDGHLKSVVTKLVPKFAKKIGLEDEQIIYKFAYPVFPFRDWIPGKPSVYGLYFKVQDYVGKKKEKDACIQTYLWAENHIKYKHKIRHGGSFAKFVPFSIEAVGMYVQNDAGLAKKIRFRNRAYRGNRWVSKLSHVGRLDKPWYEIPTILLRNPDRQRRYVCVGDYKVAAFRGSKIEIFDPELHPRSENLPRDLGFSLTRRPCLLYSHEERKKKCMQPHETKGFKNKYEWVDFDLTSDKLVAYDPDDPDDPDKLELNMPKNGFDASVPDLFGFILRQFSSKARSEDDKEKAILFIRTKEWLAASVKLAGKLETLDEEDFQSVSILVKEFSETNLAFTEVERNKFADELVGPFERESVKRSTTN